MSSRDTGAFLTNRRAAAALALLACGVALGLWSAGRGALIWALLFGPAIAAALATIAASLGIGGLKLRILGIEGLDAFERLCVGAALGLGMLGWLMAILGLVGALSPSAAFVIAAAGLFALFAFARMEREAFGASMAAVARRWPGWLALGAPTLLAIALGAAFLSALTPPVSYDVLEYHLAAPREWIHAGRFIELPYNFYAQLPFGVEMLYGFGLLLDPGGDGAPKIINFLLFVATCGLVAALARRAGATVGLAILAAAHFASHPTSVRITADAFADMGPPLFATASALCLIGVRCPWRAAALGGALAGFAMGAKTSSAGLFLAPALVFLVLAGRGEPEGNGRAFQRLGAAALFLLVAAAAFAPWPARNWLANGNPAAPFLNAWFGGDPWNLETERFWLGMHGWQTPLAPAHWAAMAARVGVVGWPWCLGALAALLFGGRVTRRVALTAIAGYGAYALLAGAPDRFASPLIALAIALTHGAAARPFAAHPAWRRLASALLAVLALPPLWGAMENMAASRSVEYAARALSRQDFLRLSLGATADLFQAANEDTPESARLLLLYEARSYAIERPTLANTVFDRSPLLEALRRARREGRLLEQALREAGFTHILVNEYELARLIDTHATAATVGDPAYQSIRRMAPRETRYEHWAANPQWYAPYERMGATPDELSLIAAYLNDAAARAIHIQFLGAIRLFVAPVG